MKSVTINIPTEEVLNNINTMFRYKMLKELNLILGDNIKELNRFFFIKRKCERVGATIEEII
jgi:hypothetical protein